MELEGTYACGEGLASVVEGKLNTCLSESCVTVCSVTCATESADAPIVGSSPDDAASGGFAVRGGVGVVVAIAAVAAMTL